MALVKACFSLFSVRAGFPSIVTRLLPLRSRSPLLLEHGMAINTKKVIIGGLTAGLVLNILDFILNTYIFGARMKADMNAFKAGLGDAMATMSGSTMAGYVIMDFVLGMLLAYTYAAMRPRFGAGAKTAIIVALIFWIFGTIVSVNYMMVGMMSSGTWWSFGIAYLVCLVIASLVAGAMYSEEGSPAT